MAPLPKTQSRTLDLIYAWYAAQPRPERTYLGASVIGAECSRQLWYGFRWADTPEELTGRKIRLFETGHLEEARLLGDLRRAGVKVWTRDPDTGKQWGVEAVDGHFQGHADGVGLGIPDAPKTAHLLEVKTHSGKSFKALVKAGDVKVAKPEHWSQMQIYMRLLRLERALYMASSKETDEIYVERIELDRAAADLLIEKASRIIHSHSPPAKLHEDPNAKMAFACGYCPAKNVCHGGDFARRNCRTCISATPVPGGQWHCDHHNKVLSLKEQEAGCISHLYLPALVPGEQIDATEEPHRLVDYRMPDGTTWTDGEIPL
jgi:hypothetical protein